MESVSVLSAMVSWVTGLLFVGWLLFMVALVVVRILWRRD